MKAKPLTIHWHTDSEPIYSLDLQKGKYHGGSRLATAGGDGNVRIWRVSKPETSDTDTIDNLSVEYLATLTKHEGAVNVVRFDPTGQLLASAGDDKTLVIWSLVTRNGEIVPPKKEFGRDDVDEESWKPRTPFVMHKLDAKRPPPEVYDIAWSPDSQFILVGCMDNIGRIFSVATGQCVREVAEHSHYVQGVAWDPLNEYLATQSSDRSVHIYALKNREGTYLLDAAEQEKNRLELHQKSNKAELPVKNAPSTPVMSSSQLSSTSGSLTPSSHHHHDIDVGTPSTPVGNMNPPSSTQTHSRKSSFSGSNRSESPLPSSFIPLPAVKPAESPKVRNSALYQNESFPSFFRRLSFSPDGSLLFTPSGVFKYENTNADTNTVYIYSRAGLNKPPVAYLPGLHKPSLAVKCCPLLFKLRGTPVDTANITKDNTPAGVPKNDETGEKMSSPAFALPYRVIYAVATQDSVVIYDTEQHHPLGIATSLHFAPLTDLSWSDDGRNLFVSSVDGFCSALTFSKEDLGELYTGEVPATSTVTGAAPTATPMKTPPTSSNETLSDNRPKFSQLPTVPSFTPTSNSSSVFRSMSASSSPASGSSQMNIMTPTHRPLQTVNVPGLSSAELDSISRGAYGTANLSRHERASSTSSTDTQRSDFIAQPQPKKKRRIAPTLVPESTGSSSPASSTSAPATVDSVLNNEPHDKK
ncbi:YALIH222S03e22650g1_1 [Yarrowia lipolytica]|jgi:chromatin assembly factor 1 subunit B|nr:YALIH222S03e22650g1_1 [Yarrowia lipolytica]